MKWWLVFPTLFLAFAQTTIVNFNFLLAFVLILGLTGEEKEGFLFAFASGVFLDLLAGTALGLSSLAFLLSVFVAVIYKRKFQTKNLLFWVAIFVIGSLIFSLVKGQIWHVKDGFLMVAFALPTFFVLERLGFLGEEEEGIRLKV